MTENAISEARSYVERAIKEQTELGYQKPPEPVVKAAIEQTAAAVDALMTLSANAAKK
jgi:hypothetical protein